MRLASLVRDGAAAHLSVRVVSPCRSGLCPEVAANGCADSNSTVVGAHNAPDDANETGLMTRFTCETPTIDSRCPAAAEARPQIKILFLASHYPPPFVGGSVVYLHNIVSRWAPSDVVVYTNSRPNQSTFDASQPYRIVRSRVLWEDFGKPAQFRAH